MGVRCSIGAVLRSSVRSGGLVPQLLLVSRLAYEFWLTSYSSLSSLLPSDISRRCVGPGCCELSSCIPPARLHRIRRPVGVLLKTAGCWNYPAPRRELYASVA